MEGNGKHIQSSCAQYQINPERIDYYVAERKNGSATVTLFRKISKFNSVKGLSVLSYK